MRLLLRLCGWLLTPFLAWAASFFGAVAGSLVAGSVSDPYVGLGITVLAGAAAGIVAMVLWLRLLGRSPRMQQALAVRPDGTPLELPLDDADEATASTNPASR